MDAQTARGEAEGPSDLSSGDFLAWRCDIDWLGDRRSGGLWAPTPLCRALESCPRLMDENLRIDENLRLSIVIAEMTRGWT